MHMVNQVHHTQIVYRFTWQVKLCPLSEDEDCGSSQWEEAVQYYKANGYPNEDSYMDFGTGKFIELDSDKFVQDKKDLGMD
jgi:hypothetical protein